MRGDWKDDAMRFEGLDKAAQREAEAKMAHDLKIGVWHRSGTLVYLLHETGAWRRGAAEVTNKFAFNVEDYSTDRRQAEALAERLQAFLNAEGIK